MDWWLFVLVAVAAVVFLVVVGERRAAARGERPVRLWFTIPVAVLGIFLIFASWTINGRSP